MERKIKRGEIYLANLDPVIGSEQGGERPVLIIQNNLGNKHSPTVIVTAITSRICKKVTLPTHSYVDCENLSKTSIALLEQIRTIDKSRLIEYIGAVSSDCMREIESALLVSVGISQNRGSRNAI